MCEPATLTTLALVAGGASAAKTVMGFIGQQQAASANKKAANLNYNLKVEQASRQNAQLSEQQTQTALTDAVTIAQNFGRIATSASSLGLGRTTAHRLLGVAATGANRALAANEANYANKRVDLQTELTGASIQRSSQIASVPSPTYGELALNLIGDAADTASNYAALGGKFGVKAVGRGLTGINERGVQADPFEMLRQGIGVTY